MLNHLHNVSCSTPLLSPTQIHAFAGIELDFCSDCVCGIYRTFWSAHKASGAAWDPNDPSSLGPLLSKMVGTNRACMRQYRSEVAPAMGPNFSRRTQIQDCPWMASPAVPAPECYQRQLYTLATANFTQSNTTGGRLGYAESLPRATYICMYVAMYAAMHVSVSLSKTALACSL